MNKEFIDDDRDDLYQFAELSLNVIEIGNVFYVRVCICCISQVESLNLTKGGVYDMRISVMLLNRG